MVLAGKSVVLWGNPYGVTLRQFRCRIGPHEHSSTVRELFGPLVSGRGPCNIPSRYGTMVFNEYY